MFTYACFKGISWGQGPSLDEVIANARAEIKKDMIGDFSNAPEPIQIKIFASDSALLQQLGPRVARAMGKIKGVVDVQNEIDNTISGSPTSFEVDPVVAARLGFTPMEVAEDAISILDRVTTTDPLIANGHPYTIRVRLGDETRSSLDTIEKTVFNSSTVKTATSGSLVQIRQSPPKKRDPKRKPSAVSCCYGTVGRFGPWHGNDSV